MFGKKKTAKEVIEMLKELSEEDIAEVKAAISETPDKGTATEEDAPNEPESPPEATDDKSDASTEPQENSDKTATDKTEQSDSEEEPAAADEPTDEAEPEEAPTTENGGGGVSREEFNALKESIDTMSAEFAALKEAMAAKERKPEEVTDEASKNKLNEIRKLYLG